MEDYRKLYQLIYGNAIITARQLAGLEKYMDAEIRREIIAEGVAKEPNDFLIEYLTRDPDFDNILIEYGFYPWTGARKENAYKF